MTTFIILCAVLVVAALLLLAYPLLRKRPEAAETRGSSLGSLVTIAIATPLLSALIYVVQSNWKWDETEAALAQQHDLRVMLERLEAQAQKSPNSAEGWIALGRAAMDAGDAKQAVDAYEKAFTLTKGNDSEVTLGLAESLGQANPESLNGRAGELFEMALARDPNNMKALWYGALLSLSNGRLPAARDRLQRILAQNPPENIRSIIERQIQDIDQQLGEQKTASAATGGALNVEVKLAPSLAASVDKSTTVFVLARDPNGGPPLAVHRKTVADLPLKVTLTDKDAMMAGRGISSVPRVQVVARVSRSGTPQAQPGDLFGDATVELKGAQAIAVKITIDRKVEK